MFLRALPSFSAVCANLESLTVINGIWHGTSGDDAADAPAERILPCPSSHSFLGLSKYLDVRGILLCSFFVVERDIAQHAVFDGVSTQFEVICRGVVDGTRSDHLGEKLRFRYFCDSSCRVAPVLFDLVAASRLVSGGFCGGEIRLALVAIVEDSSGGAVFTTLADQPMLALLRPLQL